MKNPLENIEIPGLMQTDRLDIRLLTFDMVMDLHKAIGASIDEFQPWFDWACPMPTLEAVQKNTLKNIELQKKKEALFFSVYLKGTHTFVGRLSFDKLEPAVPSFNFAGWCHSKYAGEGYMGEAGRALINFAIHTLKCKRLEVYHDVENKISEHAVKILMKEFSFKKVGILQNKQRRKFDNTLRHHAVYAFTQND